MRTLRTSACLILLCAFHLRGDISVKDYQARMSSGDDILVIATKTYILGLGNGMTWANVEATRKKAPLFCIPAKLAVEMENFVRILDAKIKSTSDILSQSRLNETWIELLLLEGLKETFPCQ